jgi:hypothetical protein
MQGDNEGNSLLQAVCAIPGDLRDGWKASAMETASCRPGFLRLDGTRDYDVIRPI